MNILLVREVEALRRISARYVERLKAKAGRIKNSDGVVVAHFDSPEIADYLIRLHAIFIPLTNAIIELRGKLVDREKMKREQDGNFDKPI